MNAESVDARTAELFRHRSWMQRLAQGLLADPAAADDVVQETWLAALRHPPDPERPLRPWLSQVVRRIAGEWVRRESGRRRREERGARGGELPSTAALLERVDLQRLLAEALQGLAEPHRTTVLLRYFEDLSSAEIARRLDVPAATVRSRLKRGLDELRGVLDGRFGGDRRAWGVALAGLLPRGAPPAPGGTAASGGGPTAALSGITAMNATAKLGAAATCTVAASLGIWGLWTILQPASSEDAAGSGRAGAVAGVAGPSEAVAAAEGGAAERSPVPDPSQRRSVPRVAAAPAEPAAPRGAGDSALVEGRIVDGHGQPLAGGVLALLDEELAVAPARAELDGRVRLALELGAGARTLLFTFSSPGYATEFIPARVTAGDRTYLGEVALEPGGAVAGRVVDAAGRPVAGARVRVTGPDIEGDLAYARRRGPAEAPGPRGETDGGGGFRIEGVRAGPARVWAVAEGRRYAFTLPVEVAAAAVSGGLELVLDDLEELDRIEGRVLDPEGRPVAGASVGYYWNASSSGGAVVRAGAGGRFALRLAARAPHELSATDPGDRWASVSLTGVQPGTLDVVLQFREARELELRVTDLAGAAIEEFAVHVRSADTGNYLDSLPRAASPGGVRVLRAPAQPFRVEVLAAGHAVGHAGPCDPAALPAVLECRLEALPGVRGRVVREGLPVAGARVGLHAVHPEGVRVLHNGFRARLDAWPEAEAVTDAEGRFALDLREEGRYALLVSAEQLALAELGPLDLDPRAGAAGLEVALGAGGTLSGRVRVDPGREAAGTIVGLSRGDGRARTVRVGPDGEFRFERLTPGPWQLRRCDQEIDPERGSTTYSAGETGPIRWDCEVFEGEETVFDLDLAGQPACVLLGSFAVGGAPAAGWSAGLSRGDAGTETFEQPSTAVDARGGFRLEVGSPGRYELVLELHLEHAILVVREPLELVPGEQSWSWDLPAARLAIDGAPGAAEAELSLGYLWEGAGGRRYWARFHGDGDCLLYTSPSPRDLSTSRMPSSA